MNFLPTNIRFSFQIRLITAYGGRGQIDRAQGGASIPGDHAALGSINLAPTTTR